ncbi:sortase-associated OmpA-like protein PdsO [Paraglaciecola aestuariivivens]
MKLTKTNLTLALTFAGLLSGSALADTRTKDEQTNEVIGLSSGVIIGSAIAGPLGGVVAGIFGVMLADDINSDKRLADAKVSLKQKEQDLYALQQNFEQSKQRAMQQIASMSQALELNVVDTESNIQFKTGSYKLQDHYKSQLDLIIQKLRKNPSLSVSLSGFADQRGDSSFNQALSEQRALSVKAYLLNQGVEEQQILTQSYGESSLVSAGNDFEDDFFDRRVLLKVTEGNAAMTAARSPQTK